MQERREGWKFFFLMLALVAALFGMGGPLFGIGAAAAAIARHLVPIFMDLFLVAVIAGLLCPPRPSKS
jgi:uncharacterized membrane protein YtjA (UPF0391 family)